jgi:iron-sulfur cluster repair protein YtfE (RIC family)
VSNLDLEKRQGWPQELRLLLERHPRATWSSHSNFPLAQFWLERHGMFRQHAEALRAATDEYLEGHVSAPDFQRWLGPNLQGFLAALHGHHQVEDHHYFPAFRAADPSLTAGFEALDRDHQLIHEGIVSIVGAANNFLQAQDSAARQHMGELYAAASERLRRQLVRHLDDEEDLIIPLMLERGA